MLVLSRKKEESVIINGNIVIQVLNVKGNVVRLGITAPDSIRIVRAELAPLEESDLRPSLSCSAVRESGSPLANYVISASRGSGDALAI